MIIFYFSFFFFLIMTTVSKSIQTFGFLAASLEIPGKKVQARSIPLLLFFPFTDNSIIPLFRRFPAYSTATFFPVFYYCLLEPPACLFPQMSRVSP